MTIRPSARHRDRERPDTEHGSGKLAAHKHSFKLACTRPDLRCQVSSLRFCSGYQWTLIWGLIQNLFKIIQIRGHIWDGTNCIYFSQENCPRQGNAADKNYITTFGQRRHLLSTIISDKPHNQPESFQPSLERQPLLRGAGH